MVEATDTLMMVEEHYGTWQAAVPRAAIKTPDVWDELVDRIRSGVERRGFHIFDRDELAVVWRNVRSRSARMGTLQLLARECAAVIDPESRFNSVRFNAAEGGDASDGAHRNRNAGFTDALAAS